MTDDKDAEIERLRTQVADLQAQLAEQSAATVTIVAKAQEGLYWLDRWGVDLERVMRHRSALVALSTLRTVRRGWWKVRRTARRVRA